jgi:PKHD-type hydroxylase
MGKEDMSMSIEPLFWSWQNEIPASVCDAIISEGKKLDIGQGRVGNNEVINPNIRNSNIAWFSWNSWIGAICAHYIHQANNQAWQFQLTGQQDPQFTIYENEQFYDFHSDSSNVEGGMRKVSIVISITDPDTYEGGEFEFIDGTKPDIKQRGSILVFPSFVEHRVTPITSGTRYSLVNWYCGDKFK